MRNKNILKVLSLLAAICITAGCSGSSTAETTTTVQSVTTATTTKPQENNTNSLKNSEQQLFQKEFEITDWTMEELISDFTLYGEKISIPCSIEQLGKIYSGTNINNMLIYDNKEIGYVYNTTQKSQDDDPMIRQIVLGGLNDISLPQFSIKTITETCSKEDVENVLGIPNVNSGDENWARYFFSDNESILFVYNNEDSDKIKMITIMFKNDNE